MKDNFWIDENISRLLDIGIALTAEKDYNKLLEKIISEARNIANADGGTLYILENNKLHYKIMQTKSMDFFKGSDGAVISIPPVEMVRSNVSAYCALSNEIINIPDVYHSELFDFSGPKRFDESTGYVTKSMLVIPLTNRERKVIGVLQLINALDANHKPVSFEPYLETIIASLASQAAIAIENMRYVEEIKRFFDSFVEVMATAIDERTPYNASHSKNIAKLMDQFALYINRSRKEPFQKIFFDGPKRNEMVTAAWLHDIGKIAVPIEVLDKPTRMGERLTELLLRWDLIETKLRLRYLEQICSNGLTEMKKKTLEEEWIFDSNYLRQAREFVLHLNEPATFVDLEKRERLDELKHHSFLEITEPLLLDSEYENLCIQKGTLTDEERAVIENHVKATARILSKMTFPDYLKFVPEWAMKHHEFLDGTGYFNGFAEDELPIEVRMLTILDIYDALTAVDRPYKPGMECSKACLILSQMAGDGKLDKDLVESFIEGRIWEKCEECDYGK